MSKSSTEEDNVMSSLLENSKGEMKVDRPEISWDLLLFKGGVVEEKI